MTLKLNGSDDGSVSLDAPADTSPSGSDITLTLPTSAGSANQFVKNGGTAGELEYSSMVETSTGIGIGETSPADLLHAKSDSGNANLRLTTGNTSSGYTGVIFGDTDDTNTGAVQYDHSNNSLQFEVNNSERMRVDSDGGLGIGVTNPSQYHANANDIVLANGMTIANSSAAHIYFADSSTGTGEYVGQLNYQHSSDRFQFVVGNTERARLTSGGSWETFSTGVNIDIANTQSSGNNEAFIYARHGSTALGAGTLSFRVYTNGNVANTNNSYGSISDQNLKENIVDATSQWDDIKALQVRKYNFRETTGHQTHTQLGLIAQEVETVSPGLVETTDVREGETVLDADGNQLESIKSINYSVLYMKAVKALQEAITRIETLETQNADLLARVTALEAAE